MKFSFRSNTMVICNVRRLWERFAMICNKKIWVQHWGTILIDGVQQNDGLVFMSFDRRQEYQSEPISINIMTLFEFFQIAPCCSAFPWPPCCYAGWAGSPTPRPSQPPRPLARLAPCRRPAAWASTRAPTGGACPPTGTATMSTTVEIRRMSPDTALVSEIIYFTVWWWFGAEHSSPWASLWTLSFLPWNKWSVQ